MPGVTPFKHENPSVQCGTEFAWPWALCPPLSRDESETQKQSFLLVILEPFVKWSHRVLADPCFSFLTLGGVPAGSSLAPWAMAWEGAAVLLLVLLPWLRLSLEFSGRDPPGGLGWGGCSPGCPFTPDHLPRVLTTSPEAGGADRWRVNLRSVSYLYDSGLQRKPLGPLEVRDTNAIPQTWHSITFNENINEHRMRGKPWL